MQFDRYFNLLWINPKGLQVIITKNDRQTHKTDYMLFANVIKIFFDKLAIITLPNFTK